ncbi:DUF2304 domain-containing protein [Microbacterium hominis]|uniref:DUF2304 domain-containing protein n=1 Tax=Microbacterium hominis TaxID=162426 RepID=UPI001963DC0C|nr:DUF2304 domain-containing protein [Microbacterium hominis]QRY41697.1 DUF2304 domain-containing protein [Microbacterium hominis]
MIVFVGIGFALVILALIFRLLLTRRLREKYALLWLVIGFAMLILTVFPSLLGRLSDLLGVEIPANLLFILALGLLIAVALHQSWELSTAEDEIRRVAEEVAILRADVERLEDARRSAPGEDGGRTDATPG